MPDRAELVYASYGWGVQIAIDRGAPGVVSGEAASTTPPARGARNFAGMVRRCLASSVCSKVPRKAINRPDPVRSRGCHAAGSRVLIRGAEAQEPGWLGGRSPATRVPHRIASPTISHNLPRCNLFPI